MSSPWTGEKRILWAEVQSVGYSQVNRWFIVTSRAGVRIRVHGMLGGVPELLHEMQGYLGPDLYRNALKGISLHGSVSSD